MMALMMCFTNLTKAQTETLKFEKIYLGEMFAAYQDCYFTFDTTSIGGDSHVFYLEFKDAIPLYGRNVAYPTKKYDFVTDTKKLYGHIFKLVSILNTKKEKITSAGYAEKPIFELEDIDDCSKLYYKYDPKFGLNFVWLTTTPTISSTLLIEKINKTYDEIDGVTTYYTPIPSDVSIWRTVTPTTNVIDLSLKAIGSSLTVGSKGVTVLFTDGTKWSKPNEPIDVDYSDGHYVYSAFITLNGEDLKLFQTKVIKKYKLYIYDNIFSNGLMLKEFAKTIPTIQK
jgi:hypothetical protein